MDWDASMTQIAARLETMDGMRKFEVGQTLLPPCAIVSYPDEIDPHGTYHRGVSTMGLQVMLVLGPPNARQTRTAAAQFVNDTPTGLVSILEDGVDAGAYTAFDELTVTLITFAEVEIKDVPYMAVLADLTIAGQGV